MIQNNLFFTPNEVRDFGSVLTDVQEYISSKYSSLLIEGTKDDVKEQIKLYISKYLMDNRVTVDGMDNDLLIDRLYVEMAEFSFLTKYIFGTGIEEINGVTRS